MKRESHEERSSSEEILSVGKRRALGAMVAGTLLVLGAPHIKEGVDYFKNIPTADKHELETDTVLYTVENGGPLWTVAESLNVENATYAAGILEDLNPAYADTKIIPDGAEILIPRSYLPDKSSVDLDSNTAIIVKD
jgi:hypothetical protein